MAIVAIFRESLPQAFDLLAQAAHLLSVVLDHGLLLGKQRLLLLDEFISLRQLLPQIRILFSQREQFFFNRHALTLLDLTPFGKSPADLGSYMQRWLSSLPREAYRPPLLEALYKAITDTNNTAHQRATLTLLSMIAQQLGACPTCIFQRLIPPLLAMTGLPAVGEYQPASGMSQSSTFTIADLALTVLSFIGKRGPAGLLLTEVRAYFKEHPEHLRLLARYSLESSTLLTFTVVPLAEANYQPYAEAIGQWIKLRDVSKTRRATEREIDSCLNIHRTLLDCAEEVRYPTTMHLLKMLQASASHPDPSWQNIWQNYLLQQLNSGRYSAYQEVVLLWVLLFPEKHEQEQLKSVLLRHYTSDGTSIQRYAQHFIVTLSIDLRDLRDLILTQDVAKKAIRKLSTIAQISISQEEQVELLTILLGRLLQLIETEKIESVVEQEIQTLISVVYPAFTSTGDDEVDEAARDVLRYLPARSAKEIEYALQLVKGVTVTDRFTQKALVEALKYASPKDDEEWKALELGKQSSIAAVGEAVEQRLAQRR